MVNERGASVWTGQRFGVYQLHERIGVGGMGEVYRARDSRLDRPVAIKVLPREFSADTDRLARFEREARVLASLNHRNIATIHGLEERDGVLALVMELVEGTTLANRLTRGAMPPAEAIGAARQIADALDAAHEKGIVHRDLKPANVMLTPGGVIKVLDFGLARHVADPAAAGPDTQTMTFARTQEGLVMGTAAYMSPEQARGQAVDKRTDIWAFGCVLYEMLTGRAAFARETISDTIAALLERDPDWQALPPAAPAAVHKLLQRCLVKAPASRLRDIGDARIELEELAATRQDPAALQDGRPARRVWTWTTAGLVCGALIAGAITWLTPRRESSIELPAQFTLSFREQMDDTAVTTVPAPSPDGRTFVFVGTDEQNVTALWSRAIDSPEARRFEGTEGVRFAFWSADGRWIGFFADGRLKRISASGGPVQTIARIPGLIDAAWGRHGDIIFRPGNRQPLFRISDQGGEPAPLTELNDDLAENSHRGPAFLPDGRRFLFTSRCAVPENNALYIGSLDSPEVRRVMPLQSKAIYVPARDGGPGALVYYRDGNLETRVFDPASETLLGEPQVVAAAVDYGAAGLNAFFEISADGRVMVVRPAGAGHTQLTWFERSGEQTGTVGGPSVYYQPRISPDGTRVAFNRPDPQTNNRDVWTIDVARGIAARLTLHPANDWHAVWSPDGRQIAFASDRDGASETTLHLKHAINVGSEESPLLNVVGAPSDWSRDGRWIAYGSATNNVEIVTASGDPDPYSFVRPSRQGGARFSPDARWIAYTSDETGRFEVFVRTFDGGPAESDSIQVSENGGDFPVWRADGQELYYMSADFTIYAVTTEGLHLTGHVPRGEPLFRACPGSVTQGPPGRGAWWSNPFDTVDGNRFLVNCVQQSPDTFNVLMNWSPAALR